MIYSRITGTGGYLPEKVMTNADLEKIVDTTDEWITERTGIKKRHIVSDDEATCDLAEKAAIDAIDAAGINKEDIEEIAMEISENYSDEITKIKEDVSKTRPI